MNEMISPCIAAGTSRFFLVLYVVPIEDVKNYSDLMTHGKNATPNKSGLATDFTNQVLGRGFYEKIYPLTNGLEKINIFVCTENPICIRTITYIYCVFVCFLKLRKSNRVNL